MSATLKIFFFKKKRNRKTSSPGRNTRCKRACFPSTLTDGKTGSDKERSFFIRQISSFFFLTGSCLSSAAQVKRKKKEKQFINEGVTIYLGRGGGGKTLKMKEQDAPRLKKKKKKKFPPDPQISRQVGRKKNTHGARGSRSMNKHFCLPFQSAPERLRSILC